MNPATTPHGWLVLTVQGNWEDRVRQDIELRGWEKDLPYDVWLPWCAVQRSNHGKIVWRREPLFPGYIFLAKLPDLDAEQAAHDLEKVKGYLGMLSEAAGPEAWRPALIGHPYVEAIRVRIAEDGGTLRIGGAPRKMRFQDGDTVAVERAGQTIRGKVARLYVVAPDERITLLVDMFGGSVRMSVPAGDVAKTEAIIACASVSTRRAPPKNLRVKSRRSDAPISGVMRTLGAR